MGVNSQLFSVSTLLLPLAFQFPPHTLLSLTLFENLMLAYPPHHIFVISSVSYKFICFMLPKLF